MREKICGIYCITNKVNGKKIIGQSKDIEMRWIDYRKLLRKGNYSNTHLQRAWNKYGENNFIFEFLYLCPENDLNDQEVRLIKEFNTISRDHGYNLQSGGNRPVHSEETKEKIRIGKLGSKNGMFGIHRCGKDSHMFGKKATEETKRKIGEASRNASPETREKQRLSRIGKPRSEETKQKISKAMKGENCYNFGKHLSEETKRKSSESNKAFWAKQRELKQT